MSPLQRAQTATIAGAKCLYLLRCKTTVAKRDAAQPPASIASICEVSAL